MVTHSHFLWLSIKENTEHIIALSILKNSARNFSSASYFCMGESQHILLGRKIYYARHCLPLNFVSFSIIYKFFLKDFPESCNDSWSYSSKTICMVFS